MFSLHEIYDLGTRIEKNGELFYRKAIQRFSDEGLRCLLSRLADDEVRHEEFFARKKSELREKPEDPEIEATASAILQEILGDQTFSLKEANPADLKSEKDLLNLAVEFENDRILFYEMLTPLVTAKQALKGLEEIIQEEKRHIETLRAFQK